MSTTMADQLCDALMALDRSHSRTTWASTPGLSDRQIERYLAREHRDLVKMYVKYHAKRRYVKESMGGKMYDLILPDGSVYAGVISVDNDLDELELVE